MSRTDKCDYISAINGIDMTDVTAADGSIRDTKLLTSKCHPVQITEKCPSCDPFDEHHR